LSGLHGTIGKAGVTHGAWIAGKHRGDKPSKLFLTDDIGARSCKLVA
jgi:hypothetical protein